MNTAARRASRRLIVLIGQLLPNERVEGVWGNREVPPHEAKEGGNVGETWFPPRERAEGERRSRVPVAHDPLQLCLLRLGQATQRRADLGGDRDAAQPERGLRRGVKRKPAERRAERGGLLPQLL